MSWIDDIMNKAKKQKPFPHPKPIRFRQFVIDKLTIIEALIKEILKQKPSTSKGIFNYAVELVPRVQTGGSKMLEVTFDNVSKVRVKVVPTSLSGKPATIQAGSLAVTAPADALNPVITIESNDTFTAQADIPAGSALAD